MNSIEGNIIDIIARRIFKGKLFYTNKIELIVEDNDVESGHYLLPGLIDAHIHIESTMLTPVEYSKLAIRNGVVAAVTDPHEIANVCGIDGVKFMVENAKFTPMKIYTGAPSCVPATDMETSGGVIDEVDIEELFKQEYCSHLSEMMNFPGVINKDPRVLLKLEVAKKYNKIIDGHAPLLTGYDLRKYVSNGFSTDHECVSLYEALEKISLGIKVMLRKSSASNDFPKLISLIKTHPSEVMLCTDDCHPGDMDKHYINSMVREALQKGYDVFEVLQAATKTVKDLYQLNIGLLQKGDPADFIQVDNLKDFNVLSTFIDGVEVYNINTGILIEETKIQHINNFIINEVSTEDILVKRNSTKMNVIQIVEGSLLTKRREFRFTNDSEYIECDLKQDVLKIVVVNRYKIAKPAVGFINGFGLKKGAIASSVAHDSHNIVAVGVDDDSICKAIEKVQEMQGGITVVNGIEINALALPIGGLMTNKTQEQVVLEYSNATAKARSLGCILQNPFMTLSFMSLLVIPEIKIGDKGLFDVNLFEFIELQS